MIRLNFTDRQRILREHFDIIARSHDDQPLIEVALSFDSYAFPPNAHLYIEVTPVGIRDSHTIRCGPVTKHRIGSRYNLPPLYKQRKLRAQLFIVEPQTARILAASTITDIIDASGHSEEPQSQLPIFRTDELEGELWKIDCTYAEDGPVLLVNQEIDDEEAFISDPIVQALIFPNIIREIVKWAIERHLSDVYDEAVERWLTFFHNEGLNLLSELDEQKEPSVEEIEDIAHRTATEFCKNHGFVEQFLRNHQERES